MQNNIGYIQEYISKKEFKKIKNEVMVVGQSSMAKWDEKKHKNYRKMVETIDEKDKEYLVKDSVFGFKSKYAKINDTQYVLVKNKGIAIIIWLLIFILIIGGIIAVTRSGQEQTFQNIVENIVIGGQDIEEPEPQIEVEQETIAIPGLDTMYNITSENSEITLINPKINTVYFQYQIFIGEDLIYESDYIPPNKMIKVNLYDIMAAGEYESIVQINTADVETHVRCNSASLKTKFVVDK